MTGRPVRFAARRLGTGLLVLLLVIVVNFMLLAAAPGDAVDAYLAETGGAGGDAASLRAAWGLSPGLWQRLGLYLFRLLHLDLGWSVAFDRPVAGLVLERLPNTLLLSGTALVFAAALGTALGIFAGARPHGLCDGALRALSLGLSAMPNFWLGLMLMLLFTLKLAWLPLGGIDSLGVDEGGLAHVLDVARHLVLPVAALGLGYAALYQRLMRAGMVQAAGADYVRTARAKGLKRRRILFRHMARNAILPVVTMLGLQAGTLLGGSVVIESVFAIPGLGRLAAEAVTRRDVPLLLGIILSSALLVILVNVLIDLLQARLDPRVVRA